MVETLIALIAFAVKHEPEVEAFVRSLLDGHPDAARRVRDVLPSHSRVEDEIG